MIIMTKRDEYVIQTVKEMKVLTADQIQRLFYSSQQSQGKRCKQLVDHKKLKRFRINNWTPYLYYLGKKPSHLKSLTTMSEFYTLCMVNGLNIVYFEREKPIKINENYTIIPDAIACIEKDGVEYEFFIEVDNTKELSTAKYYRAFVEYKFIPPPIVSISDRKRRDVFNELELIKLKLDLSDFEKKFLVYFQ